MKKSIRLLLVIIFINAYYTMNAQLKLTIESINVTNYNILLTDTVYNESDYNGPHIHFKCKISNLGNSNLFIYPRTSNSYISFFVNGEEFITEAIPIVLLESDSIKIDDGDSICFDLDSYLLLGTDFLENKTGDYRSVLLKILPTISISYNDKAIRLKSNRIMKNVTLE